ncbi:MAG: UDP-N-acetylglucosamine 4,6-dehydratase (inverting) [Chloroflexi bacterium]|nr:UDP-N-acetylglucosamine 4,6-dehydratase (inverting) [Chloroflexota bacterium]GIW12234.1 MAG: UDP-N-acetylglucosamine 4,6-dehydratase (inverting) [Dehalococcoidia bacterium]
MDLNDKVVLVTGGTGSFGQQFVETVLRRWQPRKLIVFSRDELKQHEMAQKFDHPALRFFLGDVRDRDRLYRAFQGVDYVVHAAALKQVPAAEYNPFEAVKTNILGGQNIVDAAIDCGVQRVIALSTDKAVNPVNLYGATKLCMEKLLIQGNSYAGAEGAKFACVRYGNVVGSRGSVIPVFWQQRLSGKVTVTDPRMTRFWLTLQQGVDFVLRALALMRGGEIFVPKIPTMGIMDLVAAIAPDCDVQITGIRPGEKLHEVLVSADESRLAREFADMFVIQPAHVWWTTTRAWEGGQPLPDGFVYSSETNPWKLTIAELRTMVESLGLPQLVPPGQRRLRTVA